MIPELREALDARLLESPFWSAVGWRLESAETGKVKIRLPYSEGNTTAATALHGGAIAATLDAAGCLAAYSTGTEANNFVRTLACDVSYIAGALGEDIFGIAQVLRRGKEIVYTRIEAHNADGKLLAAGNQVCHIAQRDTPPISPEYSPDNDVITGRTHAGLGSLPPVDPGTVDQNIALLEKMEDRMPYMAQLGWKFVRGGYGWAEFLLPSTGSALGGDSGLAGGALLSAVDHAGSLAAWMTSTLGDRTLFGSTVNTKLQTFAPTLDRAVFVRARAGGGSGTLINSLVDIVTDRGEAVASGSTVYRIIRREAAREA